MRSASEQHVGGLDITVHDALVMQVCQPRRRIRQDLLPTHPDFLGNSFFSVCAIFLGRDRLYINIREGLLAEKLEL